jgi:DNA-binding FadR family transcriptional regulator
MEALLREMEVLMAPEQMPRRSELAVRFLQQISTAAHNGVLSIVAESLSSLLHHAVSVNLPRYVAQSLVPLRWRILLALRRRDAKAAVAAMDEYAKEMRALQAQ